MRVESKLYVVTHTFFYKIWFFSTQPGRCLQKVTFWAQILLKEVPSFQLAWFWRNFKITKTYIYRIELLVLSINIENKPLLLMKCFTTEVNKGPFTRNNKKNQRNNRKMPFLGPLWAKPARIPPKKNSILMCFDPKKKKFTGFIHAQIKVWYTFTSKIGVFLWTSIIRIRDSDLSPHARH